MTNGIGWITVFAYVVLAGFACDTQRTSPTPEAVAESGNRQAGTQDAKPPNAGWVEQAALYASIAKAESKDEGWTAAERTRLDTALSGSTVPKISNVACHQTLCIIELSEKIGAADLVVPLTQREVFVGQGFYIDGEGERTIIYASRKGAGLPTSPNSAPPAPAPAGGGQ